MKDLRYRVYTSVISKLDFAVGNLLLDNVDCFLLARSRQPESISLFQKKKLMSIFVNNSELTKNMMIGISHKLGITQTQVQHFFQKQSKKPTNVCGDAYSRLLQGNVSSAL